MKEQWQKLKDWYTQLEQRERHAVAVGGVAIFFALLYLGVWSPLMNSADTMRKRITAQQKTLAWMQSAEAKLKRLGSVSTQSSGSLSPVAMLTLLQNQIDAAGLRESLTELKQAGADSVQLQFKNVSFDKLIALLTVVIKKHQVNVSVFNASAESRPGLVDVNIILKL